MQQNEKAVRKSGELMIFGNEKRKVCRFENGEEDEGEDFTKYPVPEFDYWNWKIELALNYHTNLTRKALPSFPEAQKTEGDPGRDREGKHGNRLQENP